MSSQKLTFTALQFISLFFLFSLILFSACSSKKSSKVNPHSKTRIMKQSDFINQRDIGGKYKASSSSTSFNGTGGQLSVIDFTDHRYDQPFLIYQNKKIHLQGKNAGELVQEEVVTALTRNGINFSENAKKSITGTVKKWQASANDYASPIINAEALVEIKVKDERSGRTYNGSYQGFADMRSRYMEENNMIKTANRAMKEALQQMLADKEFQKAVR